MAGEGQQTTTEELQATKDPGVTGVTPETEIDTPKYPARAIKYDSQKTANVLKNEQLTFPRPKQPTGLDPVFQFPSTIKVMRGAGGSQVFYEGPGLVDEENSIARGNQYDPTTEVYNEFFKIKDIAKRHEFFLTMQKLGYYEGKKPSQQALDGVGLTSRDERAIQSFMMLGNSKGRTMSALVNLVSTGNIPATAGLAGDGRVISVVSREDAAKQTGNSFFELLGRAPTPAELKTAIQVIQNADRQRQLSNVEDPASLATASEQQAKKASPGEFAAYSAGKAINQIFSLLGGQ